MAVTTREIDLKNMELVKKSQQFPEAIDVEGNLGREKKEMQEKIENLQAEVFDSVMEFKEFVKEVHRRIAGFTLAFPPKDKLKEILPGLEFARSKLAQLCGLGEFSKAPETPFTPMFKSQMSGNYDDWIELIHAINTSLGGDSQEALINARDSIPKSE